MSMSRTVDRPNPPRPVFETLPKACAAALAHGITLADLILPRWAETYGCSEEDVRKAFEREQWFHTQKPVDDGGDFAK